MAEPIVAFVRAWLTKVAVPERVRPMQAYLKTEMPFYGVQKPDRVVGLRAARKAHPPRDAEHWQAQVLALWAQEHREEKYCALDWMLTYRHYLDMEHLPLLERLIREGAWWDLVDPIATTALGRLVERDRWVMRPKLLEWIDDDNVWIRRAAILCQIKHGAQTDKSLLFELCTRQADDTSFWIRKAIGWALRAYAKTDPDAVQQYVADMGEQLSALSIREATKHLRGK